MNKFVNSTFWKNYNSWNNQIDITVSIPKNFNKSNTNSTMRCATDSIVLWEFFQHFKFKNFLEIGIYEGATSGLIWEANDKKISLTGIDIEPIKNSTFSKLYPTANRNDYISDSFIFNFTQLNDFDLILIDGSHEDDFVKKDITNALSKITKDGVIILDDIDLDSVKNNRFILENSDYVPFLELEQCELWHHKSNNRSEFLDYLCLESNLRTFLYIFNIDTKNYTVTKVKSTWVFNEDLEITQNILKKYS